MKKIAAGIGMLVAAVGVVVVVGKAGKSRSVMHPTKTAPTNGTTPTATASPNRTTAADRAPDERERARA